jgi:hypothetical protein
VLKLLFRPRRPAVRPPYVRRLALEYLEERNAPSALDPTSSLSSSGLLTSPDQQPAVPALTDGSPGAAGAVAATGGATPTTPAPPPAAGTGTFLAVVTAPPLPAPTSTAPGTTAGTGGAAAPAPGVPGSLVIDDVGGMVNPDATCTVVGQVADPYRTAATVTFSGWVMDGLQAPVKTDGNFTITFEVPPCTSVSTATHTVAAVAADGAGHVSPQVTFTINQTPPLAGS